MVALGTLITAMVTPFRQDLEIDYERAAELATRLVDHGSDGVVVAGTTGESPTLTDQERLKLYEAVSEAVGDRATVIAGTGTNSTAASIRLTKQAEAIGVQAVMLVTPYYNKPPQESLVEHFRAVAGATGLPVLMYNVPGRTGVNMTAATCLRLARVPNIVAVKEASGNLEQATQICREAPPGFVVYSGDDGLTLPLMSVGGQGVVSVASHVAGPEIAEMCRAFLAGDPLTARTLHQRLFPLFRALFVTTNPIPVKAALRFTGFDCGPCRPPLGAPPTEAELRTIKEALTELGLAA